MNLRICCIRYLAKNIQFCSRIECFLLSHLHWEGSEQVRASVSLRLLSAPSDIGFLSSLFLFSSSLLEMRRVGVVLRRGLAARGAVGSQLIPMVNSLQSVFAQAKVDFDLPQIVVVGSQSSGKSSVIESLVGQGDFLPRGRGIVTRVPLILQLVQSQTGLDETWGEFVHDSRFSGRRFGKLEDIRRTISEETDRIAGRNRGVSKEPLILRIHSPDSIPLTLVDTPGLTRIAVGGQPADIEDQIRDMVSGYMSKPNSIILAVSPANVDIATSDSLRLARVHDPAGERTIGVLTKVCSVFVFLTGVFLSFFVFPTRLIFFFSSTLWTRDLMPSMFLLVASILSVWALSAWSADRSATLTTKSRFKMHWRTSKSFLLSIQCIKMWPLSTESAISPPAAIASW